MRNGKANQTPVTCQACGALLRGTSDLLKDCEKAIPLPDGSASSHTIEVWDILRLPDDHEGRGAA